MIIAFFSALPVATADISSKIPVPKDIPLPLPSPFLVLATVLIVMFLVHIVFVNFMVGGSFLVTIYEIMGLKNRKYDTLARQIAYTITANKSLAVVLGVAPILTINTIYTVYFYTANALTGQVWILIVPLVATAFLLIYLHKYTWDYCQTGVKKLLHVGLNMFINMFFLFIPLIFLTNINLMLFPDKWSKVTGFFSAMMLSNVFFRYFHFLCASLALTGLFLVWYFGRRDESKIKESGLEFSKSELADLGYKWLFWPTVLQLLFGPLVLLTLPAAGLNLVTITLPLVGAILAIIMLIIIAKTIGVDSLSRSKFYIVSSFMAAILLLMGLGRHFYRERAVSESRQIITNATNYYQDALKFSRFVIIDKKMEEEIASGACVPCVIPNEPCNRMCVTIPGYKKLTPKQKVIHRCKAYKQLQPASVDVDCDSYQGG